MSKFMLNTEVIPFIELPPSIDTVINHQNNLSPIQKFNEMMILFNSEECSRLTYNKYIKLSLYIKDMIENDQNFLSYTLENNISSFMIIYDKIIIKKEKTFTVIENIYVTFALSWMMYEYH